MLSQNIVRMRPTIMRCVGLHRFLLRGHHVRFSTDNQATPQIPDLASYLAIKKYVQLLQDGNFRAEYPLKVEMENTPLMQALSDVWSPLCVSGRYEPDRYSDRDHLLKNSTMREVNVQELLEAARQLSSDKTLPRDNHAEIDGSWLNKRVALSIGEACYFHEPPLRMDTHELQLEKLVIQTPETVPSSATVCSQNGGGNVGTLLVHLNSAHTGGELCFSDGRHSLATTGPYSWAVIGRGCKYSFAPVTSGARVCLVYNINLKPTQPAFNTSGVQRPRTMHEMDMQQYVDEMYESLLEPVRWPEGDSSTALVTSEHKLSPELSTRLSAALNGELQQKREIVIALQHLYPECHTSPAFLKGGDRTLYDLLSEQFDVQVVAATLKREDHHRHQAALYSGQMVYNALHTLYNSAVRQRSSGKLLIPTQLQSEHVMEKASGSNAPHEVYMVTGLRVSKRAAKEEEKKKGLFW